MARSEVVAVNRIPPERYQPPEGPEEIRLAVTLAQEAIGEEVSNLVGEAILAHPRGEPSDQPQFFDRRVLYVMFSEQEGGVPVYSALVDLINQEVLSAGPSSEN